MILSCLYQACDRFLSGVSLDLAGVIPRDKVLRKAVVNQKPFCDFEPDAPASKALRQLAQNVSKWEAQPQTDGNIKFFWKKLLFR